MNERRLVAASIAAVVLALMPLACRPGNPAVAKTKSGRIRGVIKDGVISWKGIPFAAPPVGTLRWRAPQPVKRSKGEFSAAHFGPSCPQTEDIKQSEDCLTLNVWRPDTNIGPLPVMVWIHGGSLTTGASATHPLDGLARKGVVAVSMNYRLGRLGFFAHPALAREQPDEPQGNYGYLDQLAALKWVKANIAAFGGDPKRVTLFGESAGGGSVLSHLVSPMSRGLFRAAILQSPGIPSARAGVMPLTSLRDAQQMGVAYAHASGIDGDGEEALKALRALPLTILVAGTTSAEIQRGIAGIQPRVGGAPGAILDGRFLVETPEAAILAGHHARVPLLLGANDRDLGIGGTALDTRTLFKPFGTNGTQVHRIYDSLGEQSLEHLRQMVFADRTMVEPTRHLANLWSRSKLPVYLYRFAYVAEGSRSTTPGAKHGTEIPFALDHAGTVAQGTATKADEAMADLVSNYWTQFGKTGDPNGKRWPLWPRHAESADRLMNFTDSGAIVTQDPLRARLDLWDTYWARPR